MTETDTTLIQISLSNLEISSLCFLLFKGRGIVISILFLDSKAFPNCKEALAVS
jgi:hypothetical protein